MRVDPDTELAAHLRRRQRAERRFQFYGRAAIIFAVTALAWLLLSIVGTGLSAFTHHWVMIDVEAPETMDERTDHRNLIRAGLGLNEGARANTIVSMNATVDILRERLAASPPDGGRLSFYAPVTDEVGQYLKGRPASQLTDEQLRAVERLTRDGRVTQRFNGALFTNPDSRDPERAGIASALIGSAMILVIAALLAMPVGIGSAIYLNEFAPRTGWGGRVSRAFEVAINNLAAVPSIIFGLLGLAVFINVFGLMRSIPLVGGMVLALRMFPTVIIASRASLSAVPQSIVDSSLSLGASRMQAVFGQKVPIAAPGMLTGAILALAQALGETAPLLMIGMVAFITAAPQGITDPSTALPVQIFIWSDSPERAWEERTAAAILVLLAFLILMNGFAVWLRDRLQTRYKI